jgi:hypothetical protein
MEFSPTGALWEQRWGGINAGLLPSSSPSPPLLKATYARTETIQGNLRQNRNHSRLLRFARMLV